MVKGTYWQSIDVCVDCMMAIDGFDTVDLGHEATARRRAFLSARHVVNGPNVCDSWFSYHSCDVCDSGLGGMRSGAFYVAPIE
jgi:hypothetical protein